MRDDYCVLLMRTQLCFYVLNIPISCPCARTYVLVCAKTLRYQVCVRVHVHMGILRYGESILCAQTSSLSRRRGPSSRGPRMKMVHWFPPAEAPTLKFPLPAVERGRGTEVKLYAWGMGAPQDPSSLWELLKNRIFPSQAEKLHIVARTRGNPKKHCVRTR